MRRNTKETKEVVWLMYGLVSNYMVSGINLAWTTLIKMTDRKRQDTIQCLSSFHFCVSDNPDRKAIRRVGARRKGMPFRSIPFLISFLANGAVFAASSTEDGGIFSGTAPLCHRFLADADTFADKCHAMARPFSRVFHPSGLGQGERESYRIYFDDNAEDSHFILGCTLRPNKTFSFFGLYFTPVTTIWRVANTAPIGAVTAGGDASLLVDGRYVPLVPVREFSTGKVPPYFSAKGSPKNCEMPRKDKYGYIGLHDSMDIDFSRFDDEKVILECNTGLCKKREFVEFFKSNKRDMIEAVRVSEIISSSGSLFIDKYFLKEACSDCSDCNVTAPNLTLYMCPSFLKGDK